MSSKNHSKKSQSKIESTRISIMGNEAEIYKTQLSGDYYQYLQYAKTEQKSIRKSLKTSDKKDAIKLAKRWCIKYLQKMEVNEKLFSIEAEDFVESYLKFLRNERIGLSLSQERYNGIKSVLNKHYLGFIEYLNEEHYQKTGKKRNLMNYIQNINGTEFKKYFKFRNVDKVKRSTIKNEQMTIGAMVKWGIADKYLTTDNKCVWTRFHVDAYASMRKAFTHEEYRQLINISKNWYRAKDISDIKQSKRDEEVFYRKMLHDFIHLLAWYGCRTNELRTLRWNNVKIKGDGSAVVEFTHTKTNRNRVCQAKNMGVVFNRIRDYATHQGEYDFVFSRYESDCREQITREHLYNRFIKLKDVVKLKHQNFDISKVLYCFRHYFITLRLEAGQNMIDIARYTGTSAMQIEHHYYSSQDLQLSKKIMNLDIKIVDGEVITY